jgi:hypothetical protein
MNDKTAVPPAIMLRQLAFVMRVSRALYAAAELKLADFLAAGPMTNGELAAEAGVNPPTMRRLMRALVAHGVFRNCRLTASPSMRRENYSDVTSRERAGVLFTAGAMRWELWSDFLECVRTGTRRLSAPSARPCASGTGGGRGGCGFLPSRP